MKLSDILQNIMNCNIDDKMKESLITETIKRVNDIMNQDECLLTLKLGLSWVLDGDRPMVVSVGWAVMQHLKEVQYNVVTDLLNFTIIEELLKIEKCSQNKAEVPLIIAWYFSLTSTPDEEEKVGFYITNFLRNNCKGNISVLVNTAKLLCEYKDCIPKGAGRVQFCEVVITCVANLPMPKAQSAQIVQLVKQMKHVENMLTIVWEEEEEENSEDLLFSCLTILHRLLITLPAEPCPALAAVLQLLDPGLITKAVRAILRTNEGLSRTLKILCDWMLCWPRAVRLKPWVEAMMDGLEAERQFEVLMEVAVSTVDRLFQGLRLPAVRPGIMGIVMRMLASSRHTPQVFLKVINKIPIVIVQLLHENSQSSTDCLQTVVNMCFAYMCAFPREDNLYEPVMEALKDCSAFLPPGRFVHEAMPNWCEGMALEQCSSSNRSAYFKQDSAPGLEQESFMSQERSIRNRVGLNNLGNTCYMNSVIQALFMTYRFCTAVLESDVQSQPLLTELQTLFALLLHSRRRAISPLKFLAVARPPLFQPGHQQDSSEFLTYLLDTTHEEEKSKVTVTDCRRSGGAGDDKIEIVAMETEACGGMTRWTTEEDLSDKNILKCKAQSLADFTQATGDDDKNLSNSHSNSTDSGIQSVCGGENTPLAPSPVPYESLVQLAFGGRLLSNYKCLQCESESSHTDHFRDIQLAFPPGSSPQEQLDIQELLDYFVSPEHLTGENQYRCDSCGGLRDAQRSIKILQFPSHLILTLKRFHFNPKTGHRAKLLWRVECSEHIELQHQPYKLYAAVVHSGSSMDTGHYYTIARDQGPVWHIFNDSTVSSCSPPPWNMTDTPYILFYSRPEELLHPTVEMTSLPTLQPHLMEVIQLDYSKWLKDMQGEEERRRKRRKQQTPSVRGLYSHDKDSDDGQDPPDNCGGSAVGLPHNRFVF